MSREPSLKPLSRFSLAMGLIRAPSGSRNLRGIGVLAVEEDTDIVIRLDNVRYESVRGGLSLSLTLYLEDGNREYVVSAPCIFSTGGCMRIMMVIPGYDIPMRVARGRYNVSTALEWNVDSDTTLNIDLVIYEVKK